MPIKPKSNVASVPDFIPVGGSDTPPPDFIPEGGTGSPSTLHPIPLTNPGTLRPTAAPTWLESAESDLRHGGNRTILGRIGGYMQGRGDRGYAGLESGTSPETADLLGSVPLGMLKTGQGEQKLTQGNVWSGLKDIGSGLLQQTELPGMVLGGPEVELGLGAIPSTERAGKVFQNIMEHAGDVPVNLKNSSQALQRAYELSQRGATAPKVVTQLNKRVNGAGISAPMLYREAQDFATNVSRLSSKDIQNTAPVMKKALGDLRVGMRSDIQAAADTVGMGDAYASALREYQRAKKLEKFMVGAGKVAGKVAIGGLGGYGAYEGYRALRGLFD